MMNYSCCVSFCTSLSCIYFDEPETYIIYRYIAGIGVGVDFRREEVVVFFLSKALIIITHCCYTHRVNFQYTEETELSLITMEAA